MLRLSCCLLFMISCAGSSPRPAPRTGKDASVGDAASGVSDSRLAALLRSHWDWQMTTQPVWATQLGDHRFDERLDDHSEAAFEKAHAAERAFLEQARAIRADSLPQADRVHHTLFIEMLEADLGAVDCRMERWLVTTFDNGVLGWNELPEEHAVRNQTDARNLLSRYHQVGRVVDEDIANLRRGLGEGRVASAESIRRVIGEVQAQLIEPDDQWQLMAPAGKTPKSWSSTERATFSRELGAAVREVVRPAYARYLALLKNELLPHARSGAQSGVAALPDGARCYQAMIHYHTGLSRSAAELHQLGLDEMARIQKEMLAMGARFSTGDPAALFAKLRSDKSLYFHTADEVMKKAQASLAAARAAIPRFFGILPRTECVVKEIPAYKSAFSTVAYYQQPTPGKPGEYRVNVSAPDTRPRHEAAVLAFHESIPGHHLQIARAMELPRMPAFRRFLGLTAFVEGWGLYAERLAGEMGLYADDIDRVGMLDYEAWRAARLVVDTGIHAMGWSRQQAVDYMKENTALAENNIINEVDRYISAPGQALAYKVGQLEILRLRHEAEAKLGARFDVRGFHDAVLGGGAVSLSVLADQVNAWVDSVAQKR